MTKRIYLQAELYKILLMKGIIWRKLLISEKLQSTKTWGLNCDGTTRKKKTILETTVSHDECISLGFSHVAHENAETINAFTKTHIKELTKHR